MQSSSSDVSALHALVRGRVQGVFFRDFVWQHARRLGLVGYVRNLPGGAAVEVHAQGPQDALERLIPLLRQGPPDGRVEDVDLRWETPREEYATFNIIS